MPVTGKLSLALYEKLGERVANELVDWLNAVDAVYRDNLRELNELNFARFDVKIEQRISALDAKLEQRLSALGSELLVKMEGLEARLGAKVDRLAVAVEGKQRGQL